MNRGFVIGACALISALFVQVCSAADLSGNYIAQVNRGTAAPQYARVEISLPHKEKQ